MAVDTRKSSEFKVSLVNHRNVARAFDVTPETIRRWVEKGEFPSPHSALGSYLLFDRAVVEYRLEHGTWPRGTAFYGPGGVA